MEISVTDAKAQLTELVRRAEAGEEITLTRHGHPAARLVPMNEEPKRDWAKIRAEIKEIQKRVKAKIPPGVTSASLQDALYDERGLPR
jgi:prevent-host-death family protein